MSGIHSPGTKEQVTEATPGSAPTVASMLARMFEACQQMGLVSVNVM
jgi:hypothetical protein